MKRTVRPVVASLFVAAAVSCDGPTAPEQKLSPDSPAPSKSQPTQVTLGEGYEAGPVFIHLTQIPNDKMVEQLARAGVEAHPAFGEVVRFQAWPLVSAVLPPRAVEAIAELPFVTLIETALDPVGIFPMGYGFGDGQAYPWHVEMVRADDIWEEYNQFGYGSAGFVWTSVIDVGFDTRPDLYNPDGNGNYLWYRGVNYHDHAGNGGQDPWTFTTHDGVQVTHGTRVMSFLAADHDGSVNFSGKPLAGIAPKNILTASNIWDDDVKTTMFARYSNPDWTFVVKALERARIEYVDVVNMSIGNCGYDMPSSVYQAIDDLKTMTTRSGSYGAVIVASAGNGRWDWDGDGQSDYCRTSDPGSGQAIAYPAADPDVIAVGAVQEDTVALSTLAEFNFSYGAQMEFVAPGHWSGYNDVGLYVGATDHVSTTVRSLSGQTGTSFSAPIVSGLVGLIRAKYPSWSASQIRTRLRETAIDLGSHTHYGYGLPNIYAIFKGLDVSISGPDVVNDPGYSYWNASPSGGTSPYSYEWYWDGVNQSDSDSSFRKDLDSLDNGPHTVKVIVEDAEGLRSTTSMGVDVYIGFGCGSQIIC